MPIAANQVQFFKAQINDDTPNNGGLISTTLIADGLKNNIFTDASKNERLNGSTKYRKIFLGLRNPDSTAAIDVKLFVLRPTQAQDAVLMIKKQSSETQSSILSSDSRWGAATLVAATSLGAVTLTVFPEQSIHEIIESGDTVAVTTRNENNPTALVDYYLVNSVVADGNNRILTLNRGLDNAMPAGTVVSSCITKSLLNARAEMGGSSQNDTFDISKIILNNAGAIDETWALLMTSATTFSLFQLSVSNSVAVATGNTSTTFSFMNQNTSTPYLTIEPGFFNDIYELNDGVQFLTYAANIPFFLERIIPAGTDYAAGNSVLLAVELESA